MLIRIGYDMEYEHYDWVPTVSVLKIRPEEDKNLRTPEAFGINPEIPVAEHVDGFGNKVQRFTAPPGVLRLHSECLIEHRDEWDTYHPHAEQIPVDQLPDEVLPFLMGSRYCETDELMGAAWDLFGGTPYGWARVQAISDDVHQRVEYDYDRTSPRKTALAVFQDGGGVCRDFQHLAVAFCRCMNIPARYVSGYLGDIWIEPDGKPMDFHAWFQAYLGGRWYDFDARHNVPRIGRIPMAHGRDAVDAALLTSYGRADLRKFEVIAEEIKGS